MLTLSWRRPISYRKQSIDLRSKSMDWFLYDIGLRHERLNENHTHRGVSRTKLNIYDGASLTSVKPYFKNVLNSIEWPLSSIFYTTHPFVREKSLLLTMGLFFRNSKSRNGMASSINRSSHRRCSLRKGVLRNFAKFIGKHLYQGLFVNKVAKKETLAQVLSCEFCEIS